VNPVAEPLLVGPFVAKHRWGYLILISRNESGAILSRASQIEVAFSRIRGQDVEDRTNMEMPPVRQVLLIFEILVGCDDNVKAIGFGCGDEVAIFECLPAAFVSSNDRMIGQEFSKRNRRSLIEQYLHAAFLSSSIS